MLIADIYNPGCTSCKLHREADDVCIPGYGPHSADIMVVSKMSISDYQRNQLAEDLLKYGISPSRLWWASALKCKNYEANVSNLDVKTCRPYLEAEIAAVNPNFILTLGNEALLATVSKSGITKYRSRPVELAGGALVFPTISPAAVRARPQNLPGYEADLRLFAHLVKGTQGVIVAPDYLYIDTVDKLKDLRALLEDTDLISFDIESTIGPLGEFDPTARIISVAGTCVSQGKVWGFAIPLFHPESPWRTKWRAVIAYLAKAFRQIKKRIAHNGKFDCRWLRHFGMDRLDITFDTMLAVHILDENALKGLKPQALQRLGVEPWGVDTRDLLKMPIMEVLGYNFLDTYYTYCIYLQTRTELIKQPRLLRLFKRLMMEANNDLIPTESLGVWLDVKRLAERKPIAQAKLDEIERLITDYLPERNSFAWPKNAKDKPLEINLNASNFARWMLFTWLEQPVLIRGKDKPNGDPGEPSMKEEVLFHLRDLSNPHPVVQLMIDRIQWQKWMSSFFNAYEELHDENDRVHTSFKLYGTVTGRLSSGKDDPNKMSGSKGKIRGVNLQQVPRDPFVRGLFGSTPGWTWCELDYSQIELRIAAFLAREKHMIQIYNEGGDIHMVTAMAVTGLPKSQVTKEIRKKVGKPVNFGFLYDMGWNKFIQTAYNNYGAVFNEAEARAYKRSYFELYPGLHPWHERQRRLVAKYGYVESPIGRVRHLPDIYSPDQGVRAEAERQAINSPVQGLASDMALASMVYMNRTLEKHGLNEHARCLGLVHDASNWEIRQGYEAQVIPLLVDCMEDMNYMERRFGLQMTLPIVADVKVGTHWGDSIELTKVQVYDFPGLEKLTK